MRIGNVEIKNNIALAPMAGVTDLPFRLLCKEQGCGLMCTEMVSAKAVLYNNKNTEDLMKTVPGERPLALQLFGSDPDIMADIAKRLSEREFDIIDVNMGCPVPKIVKNGEGSALMKNPDLVYDVVCAAVRGAEKGAQENGAAPKPVTVKTRIGFTSDTVNAVEVARAAEAGGAAAVAVHGRTREQYYSGKADWREIAKVKSAVSVPVIGNGDVFTGEDALAIISETGCDFVMIARGALGNPWIFRDALALYRGEEKPEEPSAEERIRMLMRHFSDLIAFKGEYAAVREMRKQVGWYLKGIRGSAEVRRRVNSITEAASMEAVFTDLLQQV